MRIYKDIITGKNVFCEVLIFFVLIFLVICEKMIVFDFDISYGD